MKNDEAGRHARYASNPDLSTAHRSGRWTALDELDRERFLRVNPAASRTWMLAPATLRRDFADGRVGADEYWRRLAQLLKFEARGRAA